jgi:hypothetical protein
VDVVFDDGEKGGARLAGDGGGEQACGFVDDEEVVVFVEDVEGGVLDGGSGGTGMEVGDRDGVGGGEGLFEGAGAATVDGDAAGFEHALEGLPLGVGVEGDEVVEESLGHSVNRVREDE